MKLSESGLSEQGLAVDESDVLRGGGYSIPESGVYEAKVDMAWTYMSPGGSRQFMVDFVGTDSNWSVTQRYSLTTREGKNFTERDGNRKPLVGYTDANNLCKLLVGKGVLEVDFEEKMVPQWDYDASAKVPKALTVAVELVSKTLKVGLIKKVQNKRQQDSEGNWVPGPDRKEFCEVDKAFDAQGRTLAEAKAGAEPIFVEKWLEKNEGRVDDKYVPPAGGAPQPGAPAVPAAGVPTSPLFPQN